MKKIKGMRETERHMAICESCKGSGEFEEQRIDQGGGNNGSDYYYLEKVSCKDCNGTGRVIIHSIQVPYNKNWQYKEGEIL